MFEVVKVLFTLISALMVFRAVRRNCNKYLAFAVVAIWLRLVLSAFHGITYQPVLAGLSINALGSIFIACAGVFLLPPKVLLLKKFLPFYLLFAVILISGLVNLALTDLINVMMKWVYFLVIACALVLSIRASGVNTTFAKLIIPFVMPVGLQVASILFGEVKGSESDGSVSYIGGYYHEAAFSMILVSFIFILGLLQKNTIRFQSGLFVLSILLLILANYRTAILAVLPLIAIVFLNAVNQRVERRFKAPLLILTVAGSVLLFTLGGFLLSDRFADIGTVLADLGVLAKQPQYFSEEERALLAGRAFIWSFYIQGFITADIIQKFIGLGPEAWNGAIYVYAHNTFISYLYEYGVLGLSALLLIVTTLLLNAAKIADKSQSRLLLFTLVGWAILNMATMPLWNIEGLLFLAILVGLVFAPRSAPAREIRKQPSL